MKLDARLETVLNFVPRGSKVLDVGTDHGYLAIELVRQKISNYVIASDKNIGPLEAARKNIKAAGLEEKIDLRLGDGLKTVAEGEINIICISGMGGALICDILETSPTIVASAQKIILQPMNATEKVRKWADENHFHIEDEDLAEVDGIIYEIICLGKVINQNSETKKMKSPLFNDFINRKIDKLKRVMEAMNQSETAQSSDKYSEIQNQIAELKAKLR